ncbi:hypothetical protein [Raoultella ornithinolytica]|uniref:hypothetical protein n=1 Tax=Raoultella ornithinolytica TaxID=54291 RepID=UPI0020D229FA|nr:hypothetical protein [Raoultella ornithinolytica]
MASRLDVSTAALIQVCDERSTAINTITATRVNSGCPEGVDVQDWVKQLAAENLGLKQFPEQIVKFISGLGTSELGSDTKERIERAANRVKTPATDRIVAGIKADGVEMAIDHIAQTICPNHETVLKEFAAQLREVSANG